MRSSGRVRYREDVGWEMRCDDCWRSGRGACYWPLLPIGEFWSARTLTRCQSCERERVQRIRRRNGALRPRAKRPAAERSRIYYYAHRETILARHRARYAAKRAAA